MCLKFTHKNFEPQLWNRLIELNQNLLFKKIMHNQSCNFTTTENVDQNPKPLMQIYMSSEKVPAALNNIFFLSVIEFASQLPDRPTMYTKKLGESYTFKKFHTLLLTKLGHL